MPRQDGKKYYGVAVGRRTGVFTTWRETNDSVKGFSGAKYRCFSTPEEAQVFANNASANITPGRKKWYAVAHGRQIGVYDNWDAAEKLVKGFPNARHKSFPSSHEAQAWLAQQRLVKAQRDLAARKFGRANLNKATLHDTTQAMHGNRTSDSNDIVCCVFLAACALALTVLYVGSVFKQSHGYNF